MGRSNRGQYRESAKPDVELNMHLKPTSISETYTGTKEENPWHKVIIIIIWTLVILLEHIS